MKKLWIVLLAALVIIGLTACGETQKADLEGSSEPSQAGPVVGYGFVYEGAELIPGGSFDAAALPECEYTYTTPNCALDGMDTVYNYGDIEVAVYTEGGRNIIQNVYIIDPNITTPEGLALGSDISQITKLYGTEYTTNGNEWHFAKGNMILAILIQDDYVVSIEYRITG